MKSNHPIPRLSLRWVLILPFVLQIIAAVGTVGYLSWRAGQQVVKDLASQLRSELTSRIEQRLREYVATPHIINRLNVTAFATGSLDLAQLSGSDQLLQQIKVSVLTNGIYCGSRNGDFFGVTRRVRESHFESDRYLLMISNQSTDFIYYLYDLDNQGQPTFPVEKIGDYDPRKRPWYQAALQAGRPTWSDIYLDFSSQLPTVTASAPVYDGNAIMGVCGVDVVLSEELRQFLQDLEIGSSGETFIMERDGLLIASSTDEPIAIGNGQQAERRAAVDSQNYLIEQTVKYLLKTYGSLTAIRQERQLEFKINNQLQYVQILPFRDGKGLDWLIVVVIPEADFMRQIHTNIRNTVLLCLISLAIATGFGIFTSRRISQPILDLSQAAVEIATGKLEQRLVRSRIQELDIVATSFNSMSDQLHDSFQLLAHQRDSFERFVPVEYLEFLCRESLVNVQLGEHVSRSMAIVFSDIRSFTTLAEGMNPQEAFNFINTYFSHVSPEIRNHHGFIVKYMGDGIMAAFPRGANDAVEAAIAQIKQVQVFNQEQQKLQRSSIQIGMSIHVGHVMVGIVGETNRMQGDAFSDHVNLASRLEGLTKHYGVSVLISESAKQELKPDYQLRFLDRVAVKGRNEAIAIYELLDAELPEIQTLKLQTQTDFTEAIEAYQHGDLVAAQRAFLAVQSLNPRDRAARLYLERISILQVQGLPPNWQGVWRFQSK